MPENCITYQELVNMLEEYQKRDQETIDRAVANKAKRDADKKERRRRKFQNKTPDVVRGPDGKPVRSESDNKILAVSRKDKRQRLWQRR